MQTGTNIDRLVSVYRAAKRSGRILYEDDYTALIASAAGGSIPRPDVFPDVFVFTPRYVSGRKRDMFLEFENRRGTNKIVSGKKFVMIVRPSMLGYMEKLHAKMSLNGATLVYSNWVGYKDEPQTAAFLARSSDMFMGEVDLHTSGHASSDEIGVLKQAVAASEYVVVHTEANKT